MKTALVLLAAGQSVNLSEHQQLVHWKEGRPLLGSVLESTRQWPVESRLLVLGHDADAVLAEVDVAGFDVVIDYDWERGPLGALRVALDHLTRLTGPPDAILVARGDQPEAPMEAAEVVVAAETHREVTMPVYRFERGYPILLRRSIWDRVLSSEDSVDLMTMLESTSIEEVRIDALPPRIIDSDRDLAFYR